MKTDELVISEEYRYYVTRGGKLAVLMCDMTKVPVDVPFESLNETDYLVFFHAEKQDLRNHFSDGKYEYGYDCKFDIVGCLYFAGGYQEAKAELESGRCRKFVCCDESDVVGAIYDPSTGMASWYDPYMKPALSGHSLARSIAKSIASGDGKWLEATSQSLQSRREAVQRRIDERDEYPQYWTTNTTGDSDIAFVIRTSPTSWQIVRKDGSREDGTFPWDARCRQRLTKEQAEALLDKPVETKDVILPPSRQQLFEMVANLRDQMDHLNQKVDRLNRQFERISEKKAVEFGL